MIESGDGGAIVNVASIAALTPTGLTTYATSKGAVISLTRAMAVDHGRQGIRVNCVAPGPVYTPMVQAPGMNDELQEARPKASEMRRGLAGSGRRAPIGTCSIWSDVETLLSLDRVGSPKRKALLVQRATVGTKSALGGGHEGHVYRQYTTRPSATPRQG